MNTANKLTITLSPEEVKKAIAYYVHATYGAQIQDGHPVVSFDVDTLAKGYPPEFTGATVEVMQP